MDQKEERRRLHDAVDNIVNGPVNAALHQAASRLINAPGFFRLGALPTLADSPLRLSDLSPASTM
jgi:hypothetical protein